MLQLEVAGMVILACGVALAAEEEQKFVPLPGDAFEQGAAPTTAKGLLAESINGSSSALHPGIPDSLHIESLGGSVEYDAEKKVLSYGGSDTGIRLVTDDGLDLHATRTYVELPQSEAVLSGPITAYNGDNLILAERGSYNWKEEAMLAQGVRGKIQGLVVRGSDIEYRTLPDGQRVAVLKNAYVTVEDSEEPAAWMGAREFRIYINDYATVRGLGFASGEHEIPLPILGWIPFSHSLNPREGYMPMIGSRSHWGVYLLNYYGFLVGNRRIESGMPVADYVVGTHWDVRSNRGFAVGADMEEVAMKQAYPEMKGLSIYFLQDLDSEENPTGLPRQPIDDARYRIALQTLHVLDRNDVDATNINVATNLNILSDRYVLRDFFETESECNDKPDNTIRLERLSRTSQYMLYTRLAPNDYYTTDSRLEGSYYRVRSTIGDSPITYETKNSMGLMQQEVPAFLRGAYAYQLSQITDPELRDFYARNLNTGSYVRLNSTHEFTTSFKVLNFLNITPKAGAAYTGYYGVDEVGADNRFLGYVGCDLDIKFHRQYDAFRWTSMGMKGLSHVIRPYGTFSSGSVSAANPLVPQIDSWASSLNSATVNPVALDLMSFTGVDSWDDWTIFRMGVQNTMSTTVDGERLSLLDWNAFIDYNARNEDSENAFSNMYSILRFRPHRRLSFTSELQVPVIGEGSAFNQYNTYVTYQPYRWLEGSVGHRMLDGHPILEDQNQIYIQANIRLNDRYSLAGRWNWDMEQGTLPIQQYAIFRNSGPWFVGATFYTRDNGGEKEIGFGFSFTFGQTGAAMPFNLM